MKAVRFQDYGDPDVLTIDDVDEPTPGPGEVRVRVAGAAFNPADAGLRGGWLRDAFPLSLPHIPNYDVSGTIDAVGEGVTDVAVGDAVVGFLSMTGDGAAAQYVVTPADVLTAAPTSVPLTDAAALPSPAITAWQALFDAGGLTSGQRVAVNGAGGAVGGYAVQLARHAGAHVVAITGTADLDRVRGLGADEVIDRTAGPADVGEPVDVLLNLGPDAEGLAALTAAVRDGGVVVNTVPSIPTPSDETRGVRGVGFFVHGDAATLARIVALVDGGAVTVDVSERLPLDQLAEVHRRSDAGALRGKVVLIPPTA